MKFFDRLFRNKRKSQSVENNSQINENGIISHYAHSLKDEELEYEVLIDDIRHVETARHRNERKCKVIIAKVMEKKTDEENFPEVADDLCFELAENLEVNKQILDTVSSFYIQQKKNADTENERGRYYLGEILEHYIDGKKCFVQGIKSKTLGEWFNKYLNIRKQLEIRKSVEEKGRNERQEFKERIKSIKGWEEEKEKKHIQEEKKKTERVNKPFLKDKAKGIHITGNIYEDYDGVNISKNENRGDILRIRGLRLLGKDSSGEFLYYGYIGSTPNENDADYFDYWSMTDFGIMSPVCFETYKRIDDIVRDGDQEEIIEILKFLSDPRNFINKSRLSYIGKIKRTFKIDDKGKIVKKIVVLRGEKAKSSAMAGQIKRLQGDYALNKSVFLGNGR